MNKFKELAKKETTLSELMVGRKLETEEIIAMLPDGATVIACDMVTTEDAHYAVVQFSEVPDAFYTGGLVLTHIVDAWIKEYDGDMTLLNHDLRESGGVKIKLTAKKTKNGKSVTSIEVV